MPTSSWAIAMPPRPASPWRGWCAIICARLGYSVEYNHPYKGVELVRRYGRPAEHRHSLQLEVNRKLYMDEATLEMHAGFAQLQAHLRSLVDLLLQTDPRRL